MGCTFYFIFFEWNRTENISIIATRRLLDFIILVTQRASYNKQEIPIRGEHVDWQPFLFLVGSVLLVCLVFCVFFVLLVFVLCLWIVHSRFPLLFSLRLIPYKTISAIVVGNCVCKFYPLHSQSFRIVFLGHMASICIS